MRIECGITGGYLEGDYSEIESTFATCAECGNRTEAYGTSEASVRRCLVAMRETCPMGGANYYTESTENSP